MYKLDKEWFKENDKEIVLFGRHSKSAKFFPKLTFSEEQIVVVEGNQDVLKELYEIGKPYVSLHKGTCKPNEDCSVDKKPNKKIKKSNKHESKEQVLPKTSEEK